MVVAAAFLGLAGPTAEGGLEAADEGGALLCREVGRRV
jgi:hypothetical protein